MMLRLLCVLLVVSHYQGHSGETNFNFPRGYQNVTIFRFRGRYLSRRIPYPSNGSFNPFAISNKEAHILNGNINNLEAAKMCEENSYSFGRDHFSNYCLNNAGKFSCAVDCFLELCYGVFCNHLHSTTRNEFFDVIYESCNQRENLGAIDIVREPVWLWLRDHCSSFSAMTANAVFSDIFTLNTVGELSEDLKSLFVVQQCNQSCCASCGNQIIYKTGIFVLYITCPNIISTQFANHVSEAVLPHSRALYCESCQKHSGDVSALRHFVTLPTFLTIELSSNCIDQITFPLTMDVLENYYSLKAVVRSASQHFTIAINKGTHWLYFDDICRSIQQYSTFQNLLIAHANGWYFAVYEKSAIPFIDSGNAHAAVNQSKYTQEYLTGHSVPKVLINDTLTVPSNKHIAQAKQNAYMKEYRKKRKSNETAEEQLAKKQKQNAYMKEYRRRKKNNESQSETLARQGKQNIYMREYNRRKKNIETDTKKFATEEKQNTNMKENHEKSEKQLGLKQKKNAYMKEYRRRKKNNEFHSEKLTTRRKQNIYMKEYNNRKKDVATGRKTISTEEEQNTAMKEDHAKSVHGDFKMQAKLTREEKQNTDIMEDHAKSVNSHFKMQADQNVFKCVVEKEKYLSLFDSQTNGPIHLQEWAKKNMRDFHNSLKFKIYKCNICHEAWPLSEKCKDESTYVCSRCLRDKNATKKFSVDNNMIPSQAPKELQGLTQLEEMLIARVFPVISVYTKPGGQKAYKGHCINFSQDIQELANSLPRYPRELPVIVVSVKGKDNTYKDLTVRREKVSCALHWLVQHNPVYKNITIDYDCLSSLPSEGIPSELHQIDCIENTKDKEMDPDRGPLDVNEIPFNEETELSSTILNPVTLKPQKQLITDQLLQKHKLNWPHRDASPLNEFKIEFLATMAFPTLFPDAKGDPTNTAIKRGATLGEKIKHLIKFAEYSNDEWTYRFASHPRFAYWAFNMIQRHRLLSQGSIFLKQNPSDAKLTVEQLKQMLQSNNHSTLMSKLMHYAKNITGSNSYWHKAKEDLRATVAQVGPPTIFFTLSCAEYHWPEFHNLLSNDHCGDITPKLRQKHVIDNPHLIDWFFTERTDRFVKFWLNKSLQASWYWYRYEYAVQRGSIHCHGVAKLQNDPGLCELTAVALQGFLASKYIKEHQANISNEELQELKNKEKRGENAEATVCQYVNFLLTTWNPCSPDEGWSKPNSHPCQTPYLSLKEEKMEDDYVNLLNSVQRHTLCSTKYCLREKDGCELCCRFNFPFDNCKKTRIDFEPVHTKSGQPKYKAVIVTKRNDSRLNRHQPLQLQGWRANCDIQIIVDYQACLEYLVKYTSKGEKASSVVNNAFTTIVQKLSDTSDIHNTFKQIMIKSVGQRDYSIQEVMHHLLSLKCVSATYEVINASLDGSRRIQIVRDKEYCTAPSMLDIYAERRKYMKTFPSILECNFVQFTSTYINKGSKLEKRKRPVIVKTYPNYSSNPQNQHYGLFCKYQLLKYKPWEHTPDDAWSNAEHCNETFKTCWMNFLCSNNGKAVVPDWEIKLQALKESIKLETDNFTTENDEEEEKEEWMLMSELNIQNITNDAQSSVLAPEGYWHNVTEHFDEEQLNSVVSWLANQKSMNNPQWQMPTRIVDISSFSTNQRLAYNVVCDHFNRSDKEPILLLIKGIAGSGKSYLIDAIRNVLQTQCKVLAYTGKASFNVNGVTLHSFLKLPIGSKRLTELKGIALQQLQSNVENLRYLIIDEYSLVGQSLLGWIDSRCRQATGLANQSFGGLSVIVVGDIAQLPPVGDKPLYHSMPKTDKQIQGHLMYQQFNKVVALTVNHRVDGNSSEQHLFRDLLLRARNGESTPADWHTLLSRTPDRVSNIQEFEMSSIRLSYLKSSVAEINIAKLKALNQPIATIKARHSGGAQNLSSDEMGGLEPVIYLAKGARVMLTMNIWTEVGLCNGALGTVLDFVYPHDQTPPTLPICVLVQFDDDYNGPTLSARFPRCVPICPITQVSQNLGQKCERQQLPLKLAWAITIHKSQGLTLKKAWVDLGPSEKSSGMTYVALSRVKKLEDLMVEPMTLDRLQAPKKMCNLNYRLKEEERLDGLAQDTLDSLL